MTIGFFPGQGSQYAGMGRLLHDALPEARELMERAESVLGFRLSKLMFEGPEEELRRTENASVALFVDSMMALRAFRLAGGTLDAIAGHSLGQYSALCAAGVVGFDDGVALVRRRGELLARAAERNPGTMAAVVGLSADQIREVVDRASSRGVVVCANFNSPVQTVVSGEEAAVEEAVRLALEAGARKVRPLRVVGAFHSPLMGSAREELAEALAAVPFSDPVVPTIDSVAGALAVSGEELRASMLAQPVSPVRWTDVMEVAVAMGVETGVEVGPGRVLCGLLRGFAPEIPAVNVESVESARAAVVLQRGGRR